MTYRFRCSLAGILLVFFSVLAGCGSSGGNEDQSSSEEDVDESPPAAEPAEATLAEEPAGRVVEVGNGPEGIVADPATGLVAVGLREPAELALVDGGSGEVLQSVELPEAPRHLGLTGPGGPVLVPVESGAGSLVQVSLPEGEVVAETAVGTIPHDAASAPNGRIFVANEFSDTLSVIEDGAEVETVEAPQQPGGVAVTSDGAVGVLGVKSLTLEVFDSDTLESLGTLDAGDGPTHLVAGPDDRFYVTDTRGGSILVYEPRPEPELLYSLPLPGSPYGIDVDPERGHLWVTLTAENRVVQFALEEDALRELASYPTVAEPNTVAVNTANGRVFVTGGADGELQILDPRSG